MESDIHMYHFQIHVISKLIYIFFLEECTIVQEGHTVLGSKCSNTMYNRNVQHRTRLFSRPNGIDTK